MDKSGYNDIQAGIDNFLVHNTMEQILTRRALAIDAAKRRGPGTSVELKPLGEVVRGLRVVLRKLK